MILPWMREGWVEMPVVSLVSPHHHAWMQAAKAVRCANQTAPLPPPPPPQPLPVVAWLLPSRPSSAVRQGRHEVIAWRHHPQLRHRVRDLRLEVPWEAAVVSVGWTTTDSTPTCFVVMVEDLAPLLVPVTAPLPRAAPWPVSVMLLEPVPWPHPVLACLLPSRSLPAVGQGRHEVVA